MASKMKSLLKFLDQIISKNIYGKIISRVAFLILVGVLASLIMKQPIGLGVLLGLVGSLMYIFSGILNIF